MHIRTASAEISTCTAIGCIPELFKESLRKIGDQVVLCCRGVVPFEVLVHVAFVDCNDPWLIGGRLVTSKHAAVTELHDCQAAQ